MVTFAPNIQTQGDPEYLRYSKPISQPEGNKSGYYLAKGLGDAVESGFDDADKVVSNYVQNKSYEQRKEAAEKEEASIDPVWQQYFGNQENTPQNQPAAPSLVQNQPGGDQPLAVTQGIKQAGTLNERWINGKISQTDYKSEIARIAKDLNTQYPAYRDAISKGFSRATGEGSADAMIKSKIQDLDRLMQGLKNEDNKVDSNLMGSLDQMPPDVRARIIHDRWGRAKDDPQYLTNEKALQIGNQAKWIDVSKNRDIKDLEYKDKQRGVEKNEAMDHMNDVFATSSQEGLHNFAIKMGASSLGELREKLTALSKNPDSQEALKTINDYTTTLQSYEADLRKQGAALVKASGGKLSMADVNTQISSILQTQHQYLELAQDPKRVGSALYAATQHMEAQQRDIGFQASQSQLYKELSFLKLFRDQGALGDWVVDQFVHNNTNYNERLGKDLNSFIKNSIVSTPPEMGGKSTNAAPSALDAIDNAQTKGAKTPTLLAYANFAKNIANPLFKDEEAKKLAYTYFNPKNMEMVGRWTRAAIDPKTGGTYSNQFNVYETLGSKAIADRIFKMNDPVLTKYYTDFMEKSFQNYVYPGLMSDASAAFSTDKYQIAFNPENQHFMVRQRPDLIDTPDYYSGLGKDKSFAQKANDRFSGRDIYGRSLPDPIVTDTITRLNKSIDMIKNVAEHTGQGDMTANLVRLIIDKNPQAFSRELPGLSGAANKAIQQQIMIKEMQNKSSTKRTLEEADKVQ